MLYDDQADLFDERAPIPDRVGEAMAEAVARIAGLEAGDTLLEVGVGTGMLSLPLAQGPYRYIGFDRSEAMLELFRQRAADAGAKGELLVVDGNDRWPAADGSVAAIFAARAIHHLDRSHAVSETLRVTRPEGGWLLTARVRRPADTMKTMLRRAMRSLLEEHGYHGRSHERRSGELFDALEQHGARRCERVVVARWSRMLAPLDALGRWERKEGLGGLDVPEDVERRVLEDLRDWAGRTYGDIARPIEQEEFLELESLQLPMR